VRITRFEAENFKRLRTVDITPDPESGTVIVGGRNAQGKTSVLDGIMAALAGRAGSKELVRPIRDGEAKARVIVELEDLVIERKWTPSGSTLTVSPKDGVSRLNSPQAVLDKFIGALSFDPLKFAESEPKDQVKTLINLIGREAFDEIAQRRQGAYEMRTDVNRQLKSVKARREAMGIVPEVQPVDVAEVTNRFLDAQRLEQARDDWGRLQRQIEDLQAQQEEVGRKAKEINAKYTTRTLEPAHALQEMMRVAETRNRQAREFDDARTLDEELAAAEQEAARLTTMMSAADEERAALIASAPLPVPGLGFDEDGVTLNGVPFIQSSAAERLKVSVAMAMAFNPELRVICIRDASLLDDDSKRTLAQMAQEHDYQIWLEVVGDPGEVGVVIEDGQVQS
jgi:hypothetical protein